MLHIHVVVDLSQLDLSQLAIPVGTPLVLRVTATDATIITGARSDVPVTPIGPASGDPPEPSPEPFTPIGPASAASGDTPMDHDGLDEFCLPRTVDLTLGNFTLPTGDAAMKLNIFESVMKNPRFFNMVFGCYYFVMRLAELVQSNNVVFGGFVGMTDYTFKIVWHGYSLGILGVVLLRRDLTGRWRHVLWPIVFCLSPSEDYVHYELMLRHAQVLIYTTFGAMGVPFPSTLWAQMHTDWGESSIKGFRDKAGLIVRDLDHLYRNVKKHVWKEKGDRKDVEVAQVLDSMEELVIPDVAMPESQPSAASSESEAEAAESESEAEVEEARAAEAGSGNKKPATKYRLNAPGRLEAFLHYVRMSAYLPTLTMFSLFWMLMLSRIKKVWKASRFADYFKTEYLSEARLNDVVSITSHFWSGLQSRVKAGHGPKQHFVEAFWQLVKTTAGMNGHHTSVKMLLESLERMCKQACETPGYTYSLCGPDIECALEGVPLDSPSTDLIRGVGRSCKLLGKLFVHPTMLQICEAYIQTEGANIMRIGDIFVLSRWKRMSDGISARKAAAIGRMVDCTTAPELLIEWRRIGIVEKKRGEDDDSVNYQVMKLYFEELTYCTKSEESWKCACEVFIDYSECAHVLAVRNIFDRVGVHLLQHEFPIGLGGSGGRIPLRKAQRTSCYENQQMAVAANTPKKKSGDCKIGGASSSASGSSARQLKRSQSDEKDQRIQVT